MKNKIVKQLLGISVATVLFAGMPMFVLADTYDISYGDITITTVGDHEHQVKYYDSEGSQMTTPDNEPDHDPIVTGTTTEHTVTINATDGDAYVTIENLTIDVSGTGSSYPVNSGDAAIKTTGAGDVDIELNGASIIASGVNCAGLQKENTGNLTIKDEIAFHGEKQGFLKATGGERGAGIGGGDFSSGEVTIEGGKVFAGGGLFGAGIGGGNHGAGTVTITGGEVSAGGGSFGAGIGGGSDADGTVTITGGDVTATGGECGAGIGGGGFSSGSSFKVNGPANVKVAGGGEGSALLSHGTGAAVGEGGAFLGDDTIDGEFKSAIVLESFTGSVIFYLPGTGIPDINLYPESRIDQDHPYIVGELPSITNPEEVGSPKQINDSRNRSDTDNNTSNNDSETTTPWFAGITTDLLIRQINGLMRTSNTGTVTIDFGRNICLTPELMKTLFETGNVAKNCTFTYKGKRYNLYIPVIDTKSDKYLKAMDELKKEDNGKGFAGFMRTKDIFKGLGVTMAEIKQ